MTIETITTNELKKGTEVVLRGTGWKAIIQDNKKGNIRMAEVFGIYTETGSIYAHDIAYAIIDGKRKLIELTDSQKKCKQLDSIF